MSTFTTHLRGKSTTQSYRTPIYYVDLTLRDGINLQEAIISAKQIDEQSKVAGFYQEALDHVARQGYGNASFEVGGEEGWILWRSFIVISKMLLRYSLIRHLFIRQWMMLQA
jgi:hypothetical protein